MTTNLRWTLSVPSTELLDGGPVFEKRLGREVSISFSYESDEGARRGGAIVFGGVEAFKCTYYRAGDASMLEAYDQLVDRGSSAWLEEIRTNLKRNSGEESGLVHLMISVDDGPTYEVACRSFRIEEK